MNTIEAMLDTHPAGVSGVDRDALVACIQACVECSLACASCADACLAEDRVAELRRCIRTNLDCADVCAGTAAVLTRQTAPDPEVLRSLLEACAAVCRSCGDECAQHASMHEHCKVCADACRRCEDACRKVLATLR